MHLTWLGNRMKNRIVNLGRKKWEVTLENAQACLSDERMYCYINLEQKRGIVFNVLGHVLGLYFESHYSPASMLSENHKAYAQELLASAYTNWENVKSFDDMNCLQQYLTGLSTYMDSLESVKPDHLASGHKKTETSVMVGESSSRRSNISFHSSSSTINSIRETGGGDFGSFSIDDVEIMYDALMQFSHGSPFNPGSMFQDFDEFIQQNDSCNTQLNGLLNRSSADEHSAATAATFVEPLVVQTSNPPKSWRKLFYVSRWFSIRKRVAVDVTLNRKKQKVG